jgi:hypothetical protein
MTVLQRGNATARRGGGAARRVAHSGLLVGLTRAGFVGYAAIHLLVAWIAIEIVRGRAAGPGDQSGAFHVLARQPVGKALLIATGIGLAAMALWQLLAALVGHRDLRGGRRTAERVVSAIRTVIYAGLSWTAWKIMAGSGTSVAENQRGATARALGVPGGRWLVLVAGLVVIGVSAGLAWYGLTRRFERNLMVGRMSPAARRWARRLGAIGYTAKGAAYAIAGVLLVVAALRLDPRRSGGLDAALRTLAHQPYGGVLLGMVAAGFAAHGGYCLLQARYRKV